VEIRQIKLSKMAIFCYLIIDESSRSAAIIDPAFDTGKILSYLSDRRLTLTHIINTHGHADHTAGNAAIQKATQAKLYMHRGELSHLKGLMHKTFSLFLGGQGSPLPDAFMEEGDTIMAGRIRLSVLHTPGHTRGSVSIHTEGHVFTGDTLFVGGVGRTDLPGGSHRELLSSIHNKIYTLPDHTIVWPGHDYGSAPHSTVGREKAENPYTRCSSFC
jgi:glyoxylase-like metal-dependent hydrolase (beta-lactamase superfamily II)